jgi:hypothetical protein
MDDKDGGMNPKSTGEKHLNVLRKTDKEMVDTGDLNVKYNAEDRLYKDLEKAEYEPKDAAKKLKKRQDAEEKETADVLKDKIENLTREQKERLVREYVRRKIASMLIEQPVAAPEEEAPTEEPPAEEPAAETPPADAAATDTTTPPAPDMAAPPAPDMSAEVPTETPTDAPAETPAETPAPDASAEAPAAQPEASPETTAVMDLDRFVNYLKTQEGNIARAKITLKAINLALKDAEPADQANFYKMIRIAMVKKLASINAQVNNKK